VLSEIRIIDDPLGFVFAFANCGLFMLYVMLGHRISNSSADGGGIDRLAAAMIFAFIAVSPIGLFEALPAFSSIGLLAAAVGVGLCSSVIPYVADQLAMRMVRRSTFALLLCLLPVSATVMGLVILQQLPTPQDLVGIALVVVAVAVHRPAE
jgi:inner membrane transporter RhtA